MVYGVTTLPSPPLGGELNLACIYAPLFLFLQHIILCEPTLNPSFERQAIGRSLRMGQDKAVTVSRLLMRGACPTALLAKHSHPTCHGCKRCAAAVEAAWLGGCLAGWLPGWVAAVCWGISAEPRSLLCAGTIEPQIAQFTQRLTTAEEEEPEDQLESTAMEANLGEGHGLWVQKATVQGVWAAAVVCRGTDGVLLPHACHADCSLRKLWESARGCAALGSQLAFTLGCLPAYPVLLPVQPQTTAPTSLPLRIFATSCTKDRSKRKTRKTTNECWQSRAEQLGWPASDNRTAILHTQHPYSSTRTDHAGRGVACTDYFYAYGCLRKRAHATPVHWACSQRRGSD
jgi:hypothetical protein